MIDRPSHATLSASYPSPCFRPDRSFPLLPSHTAAGASTQHLARQASNQLLMGVGMRYRTYCNLLQRLKCDPTATPRSGDLEAFQPLQRRSSPGWTGVRMSSGTRPRRSSSSLSITACLPGTRIPSSCRLHWRYPGAGREREARSEVAAFKPVLFLKGDLKLAQAQTMLHHVAENTRHRQSNVGPGGQAIPELQP